MTSGDANVGTVDLYLPMELIVAVKDTTLQMLGTMQGGPAQQHEQEEMIKDLDEEDKDTGDE